MWEFPDRWPHDPELEWTRGVVPLSEAKWWDWGKTPVEIAMDKANIFINEDKSGPVKLGGAWLRPLKFLGMEYDGNKQTFRASTRKGATLEFDSLRAVHAYMHSQRGLNGLTFPETRPGSGQTWNSPSDMETTFKNMGGQAIVKVLGDLHSEHPASEETWRELPSDLRKIVTEGKIRWPWEKLFKSSAYGFFMSRMQSDEWVSTIEQDFNYTFTEKSWAAVRGPEFSDYYKLGRIDIFNSSSFAPMCLLMDLDYKRPLVRRVWSDEPMVHQNKLHK